LKYSYQSHFLVILATIIVAGSFIASDRLSGIINSISLTLLRFTIAALILLPFILLHSKWRRSLPRIIPRTLVISFFYSGFFIALFESLNYTNTLNTATLFTLVPFVTAIFCLFIFKQSIKYKQLLAYIFGAIGTIWVIFEGDIYAFLNFQLNKGDIIFLMGALSMCCYSVAMKWLYRGDDMIPLVFATLIGGSIWMALALLFTGQDLEWHKIEGHLVLHMAYLSIAATLITMYLYQRATVDLGPSKVMAYSYLTPSFLALLLLLFYHQPVSNMAIPGLIISSMATLLLQKKDSK